MNSDIITLPPPQVVSARRIPGPIVPHSLFAEPQFQTDTHRRYLHGLQPDLSWRRICVAGKQAPGRARGQRSGHIHSETFYGYRRSGFVCPLPPCAAGWYRIRPGSPIHTGEHRACVLGDSPFQFPAPLAPGRFLHSVQRLDLRHGDGRRGGQSRIVRDAVDHVAVLLRGKFRVFQIIVFFHCEPPSKLLRAKLARSLVICPFPYFWQGRNGRHYLLPPVPCPPSTVQKLAFFHSRPYSP